MILDDFITGLVFLCASLAVFVIGRIVFFWRYKSIDVAKELVINDNPAFGIMVAGYYAALAIIVGGVILGPSNGLTDDLIDIFLYGLLGIILLPISTYISDKIIFREFDNLKEILTDRNMGMGFAEAGIYIAGALVLFGALSGEGGNIYTALVFWLGGQAALILITLVYDKFTPYSLHKKLEQDNTAVGIAYAGFLVALGNLLRVSLQGDFKGWLYHIELFSAYFLLIVILMPLVSFIADKLLLPGQKMADEISIQNNVAAGIIAACSYIIVSLFIGWSF